RRGQNIHALLVGELRESFAVHRPAPLLLGFERLAGVARVNYQDELSGVERFEGLLKLLVVDAVREYGLQADLRLQLALARVAEVVRDEVEALLLRRAVAREVDDDHVLRFRRLQKSERLRLSGRERPGVRARKSPERREDVRLRRLRVQKRHGLDAPCWLDARALPPHLLDEVLRVGRGELQVVLR